MSVPGGAEEDAGHAADGEQAHEAEGVEHGRFKGDGALVEGEGPVEDLDGRGHRNQHGQQREDQRRVVRDAHDEHVVGPDEEAEDRDGHRGEGDRRVAEDALAAEGRDHLADHAHAGQNHDVDGGVRVEPEQMLEKSGSPPLAGSKTPMPTVRSRTTSTSVMARTGVPSTMRMLAA